MHNVAQVFMACLTAAMVGVLIFAVAAGLLGSPRMFILGNDSTQTALRWFEPRSGPVLPGCGVWSVSIWWYRLLMLLWALWLAWSLLKWLAAAWKAFATGGILRRAVAKDEAKAGDRVATAAAAGGGLEALRAAAGEGCTSPFPSTCGIS
jgi:hypothetical protein